MNTAIRDRDIIAVVHALDEAAEYNRRAKFCPPQHRRGLYRRKDEALKKALTQGGGQFVIDSTDGGDPPILGVTHLYSARRFHVRPDRVPQEFCKLLQDLPWAVDSGKAAQVSQVAEAREGETSNV